jgi:hypothetical protein
LQTGAIVRPPANAARPLVAQTMYKWTANGRTYIATPKVTGYAPCRWEVSWKAGELVRIEVSDPNGHASGGKGPHIPAPPQKVVIPKTAVIVVGPASVAGQKEMNEALPSIMDVDANQNLNTAAPEVQIRNNGTLPMTELTVFYQIDGGTVMSKIFSGDFSLEANEQMSFTLDAINLTPGCHELHVYLNEEEGAVVKLENSVKAEESEYALKVFPNPATEFIELNARLQNAGELKMMLVNALGQTMEEINYGTVDAGDHTSKIDVQNYPAGIYTLMLSSGNSNVMSKKIIITH